MARGDVAETAQCTRNSHLSISMENHIYYNLPVSIDDPFWSSSLLPLLLACGVHKRCNFPKLCPIPKLAAFWNHRRWLRELDHHGPLASNLTRSHREVSLLHCHLRNAGDYSGLIGSWFSTMVWTHKLCFLIQARSSSKMLSYLEQMQIPVAIF